MELLLRNIPNGYALKSDYLKSNKKSIKTLLVGSSHILYGINPKFLTEKALNYGNVSQTIDVDYKIINHHINTLEALQTIVIRMSYATLFEQLENGDESWRIKDYEIYTDINFNSKLKYHSENSEFVSNQGWGTHTAREKTQNIDAVGKLIAEKHTINDEVIYTENYKLLEAIVDLCQKNEVKVVLVMMPAHKSYVQHLNQNQLEKTISAAKFIDSKYSNCRFFNFLTDNQFKQSDFLDADHLNREGAEKFTILMDRLLTN